MGLPAEKLEERRHYLGASDAAAVLGLSRWRTPLEVWAEKVGAITNTLPDTLPQRVGILLEDSVATLFTEQTGKQTEKVPQTILHPKYPFIAANLDRRVVGEDSVLELKTCSSWKGKEFTGEELPQEYVVQVLHQMAVTGASKGYLAVLIGNTGFEIKEIQRDEALLNQVVAKEVEFWNTFVVPNVMPKVIKAADGGALYQLFPNPADGSLVNLPREADAMIDLIEALSRDKAAVEAQLEQTRNELKVLMGNNEIGLASNYRVSWKVQTRKSFSVKESTSRVLRIAKREDINGHN